MKTKELHASVAPASPVVGVFHITGDPDMLDSLTVNNLQGVAEQELLHILGPHFPCGAGARMTGVPQGIIAKLFPVSKSTKNVFIESENNGVLRIWKYCYGDSCQPIRKRLGIV